MVLYTVLQEGGLSEFNRVITLDGRDYGTGVDQAFSACSVEVEKPFQGLPMGRMIKAVEEACRQWNG